MSKKLAPAYLKVKDSVTINGTKCQLTDIDWEQNSPPPGYLWARRLGDVSPIAGHYVEGMREVVGIVNILTGQTEPVTKAGTIFLNIPDLQTLDLLHAIYFPPPPTFFEKVRSFFLKLFKRKGSV